MNQDVIDLILNVCWAQLEADAEFQAKLAKCYKITGKVKGKIPSGDMRIIEDAMFEGGRQMARFLFPLALELGRNPASIFDLPEVDGAGNLVTDK